MPVGPAKFDLNRCNESPLRGEKPDFLPVSKFNTGSLPLRGNPAGKEMQIALTDKFQSMHGSITDAQQTFSEGRREAEEDKTERIESMQLNYLQCAGTSKQ